MEHIQVERHDDVAVIWWNHEEQNRIATDFVRENNACLDELEKDDSVRGIVITGRQEKFFSTGIYLEWLAATAAGDPEAVHEFFRILLELNLNLTRFSKPIVAAINGHAVAMGCILAAFMDYRLMREDRGFVRLSEVQVDIQLWPGMIAIFQDILPGKSFRDMLYTGDRFTAVQAHEMGYVDEMCSKAELVPKAVELARKLGASKKETFAGLKRANRKRVIDIMKNEDPKAIVARADELIGRSA